MRSIRNQPFCWQEKSILRLFRKKFSGQELAKFRNLYGTLTEIDSDFNGKDIKYYTKTIATYSGLSVDWIPKALRTLQDIGIIQIEENKKDEFGMYLGNAIVFTPENIIDTENEVYAMPDNSEKPDPASAGNGCPANGQTGALEHSTDKEQNKNEGMNELDINNSIQNNILEGTGTYSGDKKIKPPRPPFAESQRYKTFKELISEFSDNKKVQDELKTFTDTYLYTHKIKLSSPRFEKMLDTLKELSGGDENKMIKIISTSIERGWKSFFASPENNKDNKKSYHTKADDQSYADYNKARENIELARDENGDLMRF